MTCETIYYKNHTESYPLKAAQVFSNRIADYQCLHDKEASKVM